MSTRARRVRLVCTDCKRKASGAPDTPQHHGCEHCGGQLVVIRYGPTRRR